MARVPNRAGGTSWPRTNRRGAHFPFPHEEPQAVLEHGHGLGLRLPDVRIVVGSAEAGAASGFTAPGFAAAPRALIQELVGRSADPWAKAGDGAASVRMTPAKAAVSVAGRAVVRALSMSETPCRMRQANVFQWPRKHPRWPLAGPIAPPSLREKPPRECNEDVTVCNGGRR